MASIDLPVVDISEATRQAANELLNAASTKGFVYVQNNDIPQQDIDSMFDLSRKFFSAPAKVKEECSINSNKSSKNRGWLSMHTETLDPGNQKRGDFKEAFNFGEFIDGKAQQPLSAPLVPHEAELAHFADQCHNLCNKILRLFAIALEIPPEDGGEDWFLARHDRSKGCSGSVLRLLYYPVPPSSIPMDDTDIRAGAHSDYGSITLLFQLPGQPGLEIKTPSGSWAPVPINPTNLSQAPILVNIGDLLDYWTKGLLKSTVHRVVFPTVELQERYSIAYFCHPVDDALLVPIPSVFVEDVSKATSTVNEGAKTLTAKDHLNSRLAATYGIKVGD